MEYRAWHEETKSMSRVYFINWHTNKVGIEIKGKKRVVPMNSLVLMKNTGKKDISGQEVFEGDFIESHQGTQILDILMLVKYGIYQAYCPADDAYMDNVGFYVEAVNYPQMPMGPLEDYAKVIGNQYKNADWLVTGRSTKKESKGNLQKPKYISAVLGKCTITDGMGKN